MQSEGGSTRISRFFKPTNPSAIGVRWTRNVSSLGLYAVEAFPRLA
jgi:hypothetical protein